MSGWIVGTLFVGIVVALVVIFSPVITGIFHHIHEEMEGPSNARVR